VLTLTKILTNSHKPQYHVWWYKHGLF